MSNLIIGFGTGRCGTTSFASLLAKQKGLTVTNETYLLPFEKHLPVFYKALLSMAANGDKVKVKNPELYLSAEEMIDKRDYEQVQPVIRKLFKGKALVDVAYYWLNYIEDLSVIFPDLKAVCLFRPKEDVVNSFVRHVGNDNEKWKNFPWYRDIDRKLVREYYDRYYGKCANLAVKYNVRYCIVPRVFESKAYMELLFDWLEIPKENRAYKIGIRLSQSKA